MSDETIEKTFQVCNRKTASLNEIMETCANTLKVVICDRHTEAEQKGVLSLSGSNSVSLCVWQQQEKNDSRYDIVCRFTIGPSQLAVLKGYFDFIMEKSKR